MPVFERRSRKKESEYVLCVFFISCPAMITYGQHAHMVASGGGCSDA